MIDSEGSRYIKLTDKTTSYVGLSLFSDYLEEITISRNIFVSKNEDQSDIKKLEQEHEVIRAQAISSYLKGQKADFISLDAKQKEIDKAYDEYYLNTLRSFSVNMMNKESKEQLMIRIMGAKEAMVPQKVITYFNKEYNKNGRKLFPQVVKDAPKKESNSLVEHLKKQNLDLMNQNEDLMLQNLEATTRIYDLERQIKMYEGQYYSNEDGESGKVLVKAS